MQVTLCLFAKTSTGRVRSWRDEQCKIVGPLSGGATDGGVNKNVYNFVLLSVFAIILQKMTLEFN